MTVCVIIFILSAVMFGTGVSLAIKASLQRPREIIPDGYIPLRRMAIRLRYLSQEGTLSKSGDVVRFDADGPDAANEFIDAIGAIIEVVK